MRIAIALTLLSALCIAACQQSSDVTQSDAYVGLAVRSRGPSGMTQAAHAVRSAVVPRAALESVPALFDGANLVACRRIGFGPAYEETLSPPGGEFPARLIVH